MTESNIPSNGWLFTIVVVIALFLPRIVTEGMFMDGLTYAAVANNLAQDKGGFWDAEFYSIYEKTELFQGHPPLQFWIQSLLFRLFGTSHWAIERIYCALILGCNIALIRYIWNRLFYTERSRSHAWLPILLWYIIPTVFWAYPNNLLEGTTTVFTLGAVGCLLTLYPSVSGVASSNAAIYLAITGFSGLVMCAFLTKGPVGLFPLAVPFVMAFQGRNGIRYSHAIAGCLGFIGLFAVILIQDKAFVFFEKYWEIQVQTALSGEATTESNGVWGRFFLLKALVIELLVPFALVLGIYLSTKNAKKTNPESPRPHSNILFLLFIGLSASLPLLLSTKQRGFYLLPALPWFALALAALCLPWLGDAPFFSKYSRLIRYSLGVALLGVLAFSYTEMGEISREKDLLTVIHKIQADQAGTGNICICEGALGDYGLHSYIQRYGLWRPTFDCATANYVLYDRKVCGENYAQDQHPDAWVLASAGTWIALKKH